MATSREAESGEISDSDSVSVTSTVPSEPRPEYPLEEILAEMEDDDGNLYYLIKWENYPIQRSLSSGNVECTK